jgi:hypothetical protein
MSIIGVLGRRLNGEQKQAIGRSRGGPQSIIALSAGFSAKEPEPVGASAGTLCCIAPGAPAPCSFRVDESADCLSKLRSVCPATCSNGLINRLLHQVRAATDVHGSACCRADRCADLFRTARKEVRSGSKVTPLRIVFDSITHETSETEKTRSTRTTTTPWLRHRLLSGRNGAANAYAICPTDRCAAP